MTIHHSKWFVYALGLAASFKERNDRCVDALRVLIHSAIGSSLLGAGLLNHCTQRKPKVV